MNTLSLPQKTSNGISITNRFASTLYFAGFNFAGKSLHNFTKFDMFTLFVPVD